VLALAGAIGVGVAVGVVLSRGDRSGEHPSGRLRAGHVAAGTRDFADAVWVFGFQTLRFDRELRRARQVDITGMGSVVGTHGRVYMYDAGSGRVGVLDSTRNELHALGNVAPGAGQPNAFLPVIAALPGALWLVPAPGSLVRFDLSSRRPDLSVALGAEGRSVATGVATARGVLVTATRDRTGVELARLDPETGVKVATAHLDVPDEATLDGLATDDAQTWVVSANTAYELNVSTMALSHQVAVAPASQAAKGAVVADHALYLLAGNGARIDRVDPDGGRVTAVTKILADAPMVLRIPAAIATDGTDVWAMAQTSTDPSDHGVRVIGYDPRTGATTRAVDLPSALFAGGVAAT
jgi:hypothetical protein